MNKELLTRKIFNDPIYGFISIPDGIIYKLVEHPYFQRLRRISQLGLSSMVYSGAHHNRFHHAIGAMYLMEKAVDVLRAKGISISNEEETGVKIAILLHDIGHGPFSHALEHSIVQGVNHEDISALFMKELNEEFGNELDLAIKIFNGKYKKKFLHQLVSSQLDMDRLDYLKRDSFFSGVSEGVISSERIITMLNVVKDQLVIEHKGIYSIEKFLIARRLMYWQVYLHKTVLAAEFLLMNILKRAKELAARKEDLFASPALKTFLYNNITVNDFKKNKKLLAEFSQLDDYDIMSAIKVWAQHPDPILSDLSYRLVNRKLYHIEVQNTPFSKEKINALRDSAKKHYSLTMNESHYYVFSDSITNSAYNPEKDRINILYKDGSTKDIAEAADLLNISVLSKMVKKYFVCYPKELRA